VTRNPDGSYTLSSGRRLAPPLFDVIGIGADCGAEGDISWGGDGAWQVDGRDADIADTPEEARAFAPWTNEERAELADEMIRRWTVFGAKGSILPRILDLGARCATARNPGPYGTIEAIQAEIRELLEEA
jgi:hypothetical protein